jgi:hypothetical protein
MLKLAEPKKDMFKDVRLEAYNHLKTDFISFSKTDMYLDLSSDMRELKNVPDDMKKSNVDLKKSNADLKKKSNADLKKKSNADLKEIYV